MNKKPIIKPGKEILPSEEENKIFVSLKEYNDELEEAEAEFKKGNYITHEELLKQIREW